MGAAFDGVSFFPSRFWDAEDKIVLGCIPKPFGLSFHVLGNVSPRRGPWTLMYSGPESQILWPHNKLFKFKIDKIIFKLSVRLAKIIFTNLFYYSAYFYYYLWVLLYFLVLFMCLIILFQLTFTFIYNTFSKKFSVSAK